MGWVLYRMGSAKEALDYLQQAYAKRPDPEIAAHLGEVLWAQGQQAGRRESLARRVQGQSGQRAAADDDQALPALKRDTVRHGLARISLCGLCALFSFCLRNRSARVPLTVERRAGRSIRAQRTRQRARRTGRLSRPHSLAARTRQRRGVAVFAVGNAVAHMRQDADGALLVTSDGKEYRASDVNELARSVLGCELPLDGLQYWVRGLPSPALEVGEQQDDAQRTPEPLKQGAWKVAYLDWTPAACPGCPRSSM